MTEVAELLALVVIANGAPILVRDLLGGRLGAPLDGGLRLAGARLLGEAKTFRGVVAALAAAAAAAWLLGRGAWLGLEIGALAMAGDLAASFTKRRLGLASSARAPLLDQVPESLLPVLGAWDAFGLDWLRALAVVVAFTAGEIVLSPLLYRLRIRGRPY